MTNDHFRMNQWQVAVDYGNGDFGWTLFKTREEAENWALTNAERALAVSRIVSIVSQPERPPAPPPVIERLDAESKATEPAGDG